MSRSGPDYVLLFGMPRSGTTWIGKVFDSHPSVSYRHEPDTEFPLNEIMGLYPPVDELERVRDEILEYCRRHLEVCSVRVCGKVPLFRKEYETRLDRMQRVATVFLARMAERLTGRRITWRDGGKGRPIVWKSIESLGRLGILAKTLPGARAVIIQRDPCGYAASVIRGERLGRFSSSQSVTEDRNIFRMLLETPYAQQIGLTIDEIMAHSPLERLAWLWILINQKACDETVDSDNVIIVRYEDLCRSPEAGFQALFRFAGLDWNEQTTEFLDVSTGGRHSDAYYSVHKDPLKAAYKWKEELSGEEIEAIRSMVQAHPVGRAYYGEQAGYRYVHMEDGGGRACSSPHLRGGLPGDGR